MGSSVGQYFDAVKRSILHKFPETTKVGFKSGLLAYEEKNQPADHSTNPTQLKVVYSVVTMSDVLNGVVPVKDGFSFARNLVIQLHTKLNLARATDIRRLEGTGKSVYNLSAAADDASVIKAKALSDDAIKITLNLCQVTVAPSVYRQITAARTRSTARYPLHASKIRTFSIADGLTDFDQDQLFTNRVPVRVLVGLLHNSAFNGAYRRSPFAFEKFGLTLIRMTIDGEEYPYKNALELVHNDGSKDNFGYRRLLETMASYQTGEAPMILPEMWGQTVRLDDDADAVVNASRNVTLFAFNFTPDGRPAAPTFHPPQSRNVRLQFKLNASAGHAITVLIYAEFENVMEIDNNNGVLYNDDS